MMNKSMVVGIVAGVGIATAGAVVAGYAMRNNDSPAVMEQAADATMPEASGVVAAAPASSPVQQTTAKAASETKAAPPAVAQAPAAAAQAPKEECWDEEVTHTAEPKDEHRIAGTAIGAVVGGVIGNQFGGGNGKKLATVAGAAGGAYAGNRAQKAVQEKNPYTTTERR
jgi:uncharacterized protein YcfJ